MSEKPRIFRRGGGWYVQMPGSIVASTRCDSFWLACVVARMLWIARAE